MRRFLAMALTGLLFAGAAQGSDYRLFFLGGQSNMDGYGYVEELPEQYRESLANTLIFHGNTAADDAQDGGLGRWQVLGPGFGVGFSSDGETNNLSDRFGPELTFAHQLESLYPGEKIAIIKYSRGGTALEEGASGYGTWAPDYEHINQYDHALATIRNATAEHDIDGDGEPDRLIPSGIVWMQGEADAFTSTTSAGRYEANLRRLMDLLRAALRVDDLPVVISRITDSGRDDDGKVMDYIDIVQRAQQQFVDLDACAAYSTITDDQDYPEKDGWHYVSAGYIAMGVDYANEMVGLLDRCGP